MKGRLGIVLSLLVAVALMLPACGAATPAAPTLAPGSPSAATQAPTAIQHVAPTATPAPTIKRGGVLRVAVEADGQDLDPGTQMATSDGRVSQLVYDSLLSFDTKTMEVRPWLARSWEISADGLAYTFHLQDGVKWHNGDPFTADDVKYTFDRILNPDTGYPSLASIKEIQSVEVTDKLTVVFTLKRPSAPLLAYLGRPSIVNRKFVEANSGKLTRVMMGTGAFVFKEWVPGQVIHLVKNPNYWQRGEDGRPLPYLDGIDVVPVVDDTARVANLLSGEVDWMALVADKDVQSLKAKPGVVMYGPDTMWFSDIWISCTVPPFNDKRVRQAISWAIDRKEIAEVGLFGQVTPAFGGPIPAWHWAGSSLTVYDHRDLEKAKALLADAGFPGGKGFPEVVIAAGASYPSEMTAAEMVASYLADLGIKARAESQEWGTFLDNAFTAKTLPVFSVGWSVGGDPDEFYYSIFYSTSPYNVMGYNNSKVDGLLDQGRIVSDVAKRKAIYAEVEQILLEDCPHAFIMLHETWEASQPYVKGYEHAPDFSVITFVRTWLDR